MGGSREPDYDSGDDSQPELYCHEQLQPDPEDFVIDKNGTWVEEKEDISWPTAPYR